MTLKRLVNYSEEKTLSELERVSDRHGLKVYTKVRVVDVLPIENSGISDKQYSYALRAHFDFVVVNSDFKPVFVVEFDGPSHSISQQVQKDCYKNELCKRFDCPILRIGLNYVSKKYSDMTILSWIIDVYLIQIAFYDAQEKGYIPYDELFDPFLILANATFPEKEFPYFLSRDVRINLQRLHKANKIKYPVSFGFIGVDKNNVMRGIEYIQINDREGVSVTTAMRPQGFPVRFSDLLDELLSIFLYEKLESVLKGEASPKRVEEINQELLQYERDYRLLRAHSCGQVSLSFAGFA
ncbi:MAG: DUF2726 domain-containing protein [Nitrospirae bacterium]|nr:DUF2726 domain-containing protein [Nitrospirota bacterium]MBF0533760.1 DUF2726 domain-containing protein [Nitrospirota bacterium]MBF0615531.1 DUF2726 domain-containing protein [Nitrospirota bacterium]